MTTLLLLRHSIPERGGSSPDPGLSAEGLQRAAAVFQNDAFRTVSLVWSSLRCVRSRPHSCWGFPSGRTPALPSAAPATRPGRTLRSGNANTKTRTSKIRTASPSVRSAPGWQTASTNCWIRSRRGRTPLSSPTPPLFAATCSAFAPLR